MGRSDAFRRMLTREALASQGGRCIYCKSRLSHEIATAEHRRPRSRGGPMTRTNIDAACGPCNRARGDMPQGQFYKLIDGTRPPHGASSFLLLIWASRRIYYRTAKACRRIERLAK